MGLYVCVYATSLHPFEDATKELEADHVPTLHKLKSHWITPNAHSIAR